MWQYFVRIHQTQDWPALVLVWGVVVACLLFICLQLLMLRGRRLAARALDAVRKLMEDMRAQEGQLDKLERRMDGRLDSRATELDARMTKKLDQKGDLIQERIDQRTAALSDAINKVESRAGRANEEVARFREELADVESRIPGLFDKLEEFRGTLAKTFQAELGSVLNSFDNSMTGILHQMKSELQMGVSRIESIETMVRSRHRAERALLGAPELPEAEEDEEEGKFAEWEEEAKVLAAADEQQDEESPGLLAIPVEGPEEEDGGYPSEMADAGDEVSEDELDEALFAQEPDLPEEEFPAEEDEEEQ